MGNNGIITKGEIQVMSAGKGVVHSEMNGSRDLPVKFLQIWIIPNKMDVAPRYEQKRIDENVNLNEFQQVLSPNPNEEGVWIHQDAWFYLSDFDAGFSKNYELKKEGNGMYVFVISGKITVDGQALETRDGLGITDFKTLDFKAISDAKFLLMEIPMEQ